MANKQYALQYTSPIGILTLASDGESISGLWVENQKYFAAITGQLVFDSVPVLAEAVKWLDRYFAGEQPQMDLPLNPQGSEFRQAVWQILCRIPYGKVITYGDIAKEIAVQKGQDTMSAQAVGGAVGHNPISIIIPCHRVVGTNGSLTGYAGGLERKIKLLQLEGVNTDVFSIPTKGTAL